MRATWADHVVGVDVGTTSTKAGVYGLDGTPVATATRDTPLDRTEGRVEQSPEHLLKAACNAVAESLVGANVEAKRIAAVAVTGQMAGILGIDDAWRPLTPYDSWLDSRCAPQLARLAAHHRDELTRRTGCPPMVDHAPKLVWWREERPEVSERVAAWIVPGVYVAGALAGLSAADAFVDRSYLHFSGAADAAAGAWSPELIAALDLDVSQLPRIVEPGEVVGTVTPDAGARSGLAAGTPVVAGMGDTAAGALGAGIVEVGQLLDTAGTAAVLLGAVDTFRPDDRHGLILMRGAWADLWLPLNYVAGGGLCLPWLAEIAGAADDPAQALAHLLAEAETVSPGADGLRFSPYLDGRVAPHDPQLRGGWSGLGFGHGRSHLARSVLEAVAFEYADYLASMRRCNPEVAFHGARAIGGGARSPVWNQIKADVLGVPVERLAADETATRGVALLAAAAVGAIDDLPAIATATPTAGVTEPDAARHDRYAELLEERSADGPAAPPATPNGRERSLAV